MSGIVQYPRNRIQKNRYDYILLFVNFSALILSILYVMVPVDNILTNTLGVVLLLIIINNILAAIRSLKFSYGYLIFTAISSLAIPILNTVASSDPANTTSRSYIAILLVLLFFAGGALYFSQGLLVRDADRSGIFIKSSFHSRLKSACILVAFLLCSVILITGLLISYHFLIGRDAGIIEVFLPEYSLFLGIHLLSVTVLALKLSMNRSRIAAIAVGIVGALLFIICCLPFLFTPKLISDANKEYTQAFGAIFQSGDTKAEFKTTSFSVPEYLFGTKSGGYSVKENILYYEGTDGVDQGIKLYFDAYQPTKDPSLLPGKGSVLIRIHGGAWNIGDKGASNYAQMNKYFASQGYHVYDLQYGLNNQDKFVAGVPVPKNVQGLFTIDDMMRHIGIFTTYLCDHKSEYGANTDSVFLSGGSAGGQLTVAVGLAIASGNYSELLDPRIKVKGILPFYPANGLARIGGKKELVDPSLLVARNSPPCLIYQGTHDGIVDPQIAEILKNAYLQQGNTRCALIRMPLASHGSDFYFSSYYNQVFLYYMERFMLEYK